MGRGSTSILFQSLGGGRLTWHRSGASLAPGFGTMLGEVRGFGVVFVEGNIFPSYMARN